MKRVIYAWMLISLVSCSSKKQEEDRTNETLDASSFQTKLSTSANAVVLDVRTPEEVAQGTIPGAVNINFNAPDFQEKISDLDKSKDYFVYCAKGGRSSQAVEQMSSLGFKSLYNLEGGFIGWQEKGMPIEKK